MNADDYSGTDKRFGGIYFLYKVAQHRFGDLKIGDDAMAHRAYRDDVAGRAAQHSLGLFADGEDAGRAGLDRNYGRLAKDYPLVLQVYERRGSAQVDAHIIRKQAQGIII